MTVDKIKFFFIALVCANVSFMLHSSQEYIEYVNEIQQAFANQMSKELDLHLSGTSHSLHEKIDKLGFELISHRRATIEEARSIHLLVMEKFQQAIDTHEKINPYLAICPFAPKRIEIKINFEGINGYNSDGTITFMFNVSDLSRAPARNHILYYSHDPFIDHLKKQMEEPYEEAVRLNSASSVYPFIHQGNAYEEEMDNLLFSFSREIEEQFHLRVSHIGGTWAHEVENVGATIKLHHFATQEEARQLLIEVVEKLLSAINSNEKIRPYLKVYPFPASLLRLKFHFDSTNSHPLPDTRIDKMALDMGLITFVQLTILPLKEGDFFREDEYLILPLESYEEARKIVENKPHKLEVPSYSLFGNIKKWFVSLLQ